MEMLMFSSTCRSGGWNRDRPRMVKMNCGGIPSRYALQRREPAVARREPKRTTSARERQLRAARLVREQPPLPVETAAVTRQRAVGADHAVTRHDDRHGVPTVGEADGARRARRAHPPREFAVADGLTERDVLQRGPYSELERSAAHGERQVERRPAPVEVLAELAGPLR